MSEISLSASVRANLLTLKQTTASLQTTTLRLSSGKNVSTAIDNPTNYFAAKNYTDESSNLGNRLDSMSEATEQINAADNGITQIQTYLSQMEGVVNDALSNTDSDQRRALGEQFNELIVQVRSMAEDSGYGGINLLSGNSTSTIQFGANSGDSTLKLQGFNISAASGDADSNGEVGSSGVVGSSGEAYALTIDVNGNDVVGLKSYGANSSGSASTGSVVSAAVTAALNTMLTDATTLLSSYNAYAHSDAAANLNLTNDVYTLGNSQDTSGNYIFDPTGSSSPFGLTANSSYWTASYSGTWNTTVGNAIAGLVTTMDMLSVDYYLSNNVTTDVSNLSTAISTYQSAVASLGASSGGSTGADSYEVDWGATSYQTDLSSVLGQIEDMSNALDTQSSKLANNLSIITTREDFTNKKIDILDEGASNLTSADLNTEGANLLSLETSQSLSVQSLSLASSTASNVLTLIRG
jgi:flagellin